jgi:hypothetical protein
MIRRLVWRLEIVFIGAIVCWQFVSSIIFAGRNFMALVGG